ncbi:MAG: RAD55 family ATPase [Thermoplasmata archaeon]
MAEPGRIKTRVMGLDEKLQGGIPDGFLVLVAGPAGSLKSSFAYRILYYEALEQGAKGLYVSMEQSRDSLQGQARSLGLEPEKADSLRILDLRELRRELRGAKAHRDWLAGLGTQLARYKEEVGCDMLTIDSLNALYALTDVREPRREIFDFFEDLRELEATTFLIEETPRGEGFGPFHVVEFLADGIVHLNMKEVEVGLTRSVRRYIALVKLRGVKHDLDYHPLIVDKDQFEIVGE